MKTKFLMIIPIVVGFAISLPFIINSISSGVQYTQDIDPRFSEVTRNGFAIASNMDIYSITVEDEIQGITIATSSKTDGFIEMDDPLPILQKLFPEKNIQSFVVLSDGMEIAYELENGKMRISVNNSNVILIVGFAEI